MDRKYVKEMLEDVRNLAVNGDTKGIIAICKNKIEEIEKLTAKQEIINATRIIEDAKYELTRLRHNDTSGLYEMLNNASKILRNLAIRKELNTTTTNENV